MLQVHRVAVIGTGLLGTSIGLGLKRAGYGGQLVGVGRRRATLEAAERRGAFDRVTTDYADALADGTLVVVATPLRGFCEAFDRIAAVEAAGLVVTDVGSVKGRVIAEAAHRLRPSQTFVGAHPMAGNEGQGPDAACADLFEGKPCVVVPGEPAGSAAAGGTEPGVVESLWTTLGMRVLRMTAADHDRAVAAVSHVPHLAAGLLIHLADRLGGLTVASTGFRDTTRPASGNPPMWLDIVRWNRQPVAQTLRAMRDDLETLIEQVEAGDDAPLSAWLETGKRCRDEWVAQQSV